MIAFLSIVIAAVSLAVFIAGLLAYLRDSKNVENKWFFIFSCLLALWIPSNYIDSNVTRLHSVGFFLRVDFALALMFLWALLSFVGNLGSKAVNNTKSHISVLILGSFVVNAIFAFLIFDNQVITSTRKADNLYIHYSNLFNVYVVLIAFYLAYIIIGLFIRRRQALNRARVAYNLVSLGFYVAIFTNVLTNLVFPFVIRDKSVVTELNIVGYMGMLFMVVLLYIAITSKKLFDIRPIITRSLGYVFSVFIIAIIYVTPVVLITTNIFHISLSIFADTLLVTVTCFVAIIFQPIKNKFTELTSMLFYRDFYDIQDVLDKLGNLLVGSVNTKDIEKNSLSILADAIKPQFNQYLLSTGITLEPKDTEILKILKTAKSNLIILDEIDQNTKATDLHQLLIDNNISAAVRLRTKDEDLGFILLGYKKSGQAYSETDKRLLTIAADEIAISLQNALRFEEIQKFNITLQQKVDEATLKLRRANDKLRALDETKDDFISMASHQLRTPLTSVKGYISMVLDGDVGKLTKSQKDMLNQAFFSSQRMVYLIADLLNVSRLKTGKFVIEPSPVNLADVVQQELSQLGETASSKSLKLIYDKPKTFPTLMLDDTKTRQVIMNFVDNAIYYTPSGGEIHVKLIDNPSSIELRVEDNGIGVPKSEQHHLFTKFYRAGNARKARPDGTGLGLFMAKKVILAEGGSIIFESTEGKGSTFGFVFSKSKLTPKGTGPIPVKQPDKQEELVAA